MTTPDWYRDEEMGGWNPDPPSRSRSSKRALLTIAVIASALVFGFVGWLIYTNIVQSSPTDIRNVISQQDATALALQTLRSSGQSGRFTLERIALTRNRLFWLTVWVGARSRACVAVGEALHLGDYAARAVVGAGPQTPIAEVVRCRIWLPLVG